MKEQQSRKGCRISLTACAVVIATSMGAGAVEGAATNSNHSVEMIERYCSTSWRNAQIAPQDWKDCTQEAFVRLLSRVPSDRLPDAITEINSPERRELNRSIWATAQKWRRASRSRALRPLSGAEAELADTSATIGHHDETDEMWDEIQSRLKMLSDRQQKILARWMEGDSIADIAAELGTSPARVSDEKYKAIQKLR